MRYADACPFHPFQFERKSIVQLSARNQLSGKVVNIVFGNVMAEVVVELGGGEHIVAMITSQSVKSLKLEVGKQVAAVVKSTDVMIGVPD
jgi:molybdopterin-binding protein